MNNELKYHGKTLNEMTDNELNQQYALNRQRIIGNSAFLAIVSGASLFYCPPVAVVPIGIGTFRAYWINKNNYSSYSDYNSSYANDYKSDLSNKDELGNKSIIRQNMYNPMYYLTDYNDGYKTSKVATNWRIRSGITHGDTALVTEMNLALTLENYDDTNVDFETIWNQGHTQAERTGDSTTNFISLINESMKK